MLSLPMKRVFNFLVNNPYINVVIASDPEGISGLLRAARDLGGDNLLELYESERNIRDKVAAGIIKPLPGMTQDERVRQLDHEIGRLLTITALKTLIYLDSWIKKTTMTGVDKKSYMDSVVNPSSYFIADNSREYSLIEEIAMDRGFMGPDDMAEDIIAASLAYLNGEGQEEYRTGIYNPNWGRDYNPSPLPWNVLKRKYEEISRGLHLRATLPTMIDKDGDVRDNMEVLDIILNDSNNYAYYESCNGRDLQDEIMEIDYRLTCALYGPNKAYNKTFLLVDDGVFYFDYSAIRARINTINRTKSGREALLKVAAILGLSREGKINLARTGKIAVKERIETARGMKAVREKKVDIASSQGLQEVKKIVKRGRPRKIEPTPVKRGRGRPKKTA